MLFEQHLTLLFRTSLPPSFPILKAILRATDTAIWERLGRTLR
jgi:hypothetical protein